jgi:ADP-heptose:LPS heptosyltransferase
MDINLQRKFDRIVGIFICGICSFFYNPRKHIPVHVDHTKPQKILIILLSEIGSLVLAQQMFKRIKQKYPRSSIYVLVFEKNKESVSLLNLVMAKNIFTINDNSLLRLLRDSVLTVWKLRMLKLDIVIDCELFARMSSILSFLSGASVRVGFHPYTQEGLYRGNFINRPVLYNPYRHIATQLITLVEAIDSTSIPKAKRAVDRDSFKISLIPIHQKKIKAFLKKFHNDFPEVADKKLVLINPSGGLLPIRAWPLEYYCRLTKKIIKQGYAAGIIGLEDDKKMAVEILGYCNNKACVDLTSYTTSLQSLMILFHCASLLVTNDGGSGHLASLTSIPVIIFYGPETPLLYGTLNERAVHLYRALSCSPCLTAYNHRASPCNGDNVCLKNIRPEEVFKKITEILS